MSTYLQLCQQVHRILRVGDASPGSAPTTVVAQTQELGDIVYFVNQAWQMIQGHHPMWRWMMGTATVTLATGATTYTVAQFQVLNARYEQIQPFVAQSRCRYALILDGPTPFITNTLFFIPWQDYNGYYNRLPVPPNQVPRYFTEGDNRTIHIYPPPALAPSGSGWTFTAPCRHTPQALTADATVPEMPAEFHDLIVWWAVDLFCRVRSNMGTLPMEAKREVNRQLEKLAADQLPELTVWDRYV